ncbi:pantoate--beta-alanine ligase [Arundinibacter roseus]|uniref:Pantothenate synthetase n=1 Tax=Arundinibacter roseus TaxID=2070510 RepID=A0A4R4K8S7_9BACT|nr:pantoate--beta-alanine ligase [Arundinibacter roseus]TDB64000.1 pantoate--beta-alanine ligase [Arundinibacter roseus]
MHIFTSPESLYNHLRSLATADLHLGFVPTMGALHEGHLALVRQSVDENTYTVCSIFVNPIQFNNPDDLQRYPRTLEADCAMLEAAGCDCVFAPSAEEMYAATPVLKLDFGDLERVMEGAFRPGHFNGVGLVVGRLFNLVQPQRAYFGQKDLQQVAVVRRLIQDLGFPIELVSCPTIRELDGLALSSRNRRLSLEYRAMAPFIFQMLNEAKAKLQSGASIDDVRAFVKEEFLTHPEFLLEYFEVAHATTLQPIEALQPDGQTALCVAANLGGVRLIDNLVF